MGDRAVVDARPGLGCAAAGDARREREAGFDREQGPAGGIAMVRAGGVSRGAKFSMLTAREHARGKRAGGTNVTFPRAIAAAAAAAFALAATSAFAFSAGDPARGHEFALERCAGCHETPGGRPTLVAPAFMTIASDSETWDAEALAAAVRKPHWGQRRVSRGDGADVIAYIDSLRAEIERAGE